MKNDVGQRRILRHRVLEHACMLLEMLKMIYIFVILMIGIFHTHMTVKLTCWFSKSTTQWCFNQHESKPMGPASPMVQLQLAFLIITLVTFISSFTHSNTMLGPILSPHSLLLDLILLRFLPLGSQFPAPPTRSHQSDSYILSARYYSRCREL